MSTYIHNRWVLAKRKRPVLPRPVLSCPGVLVAGGRDGWDGWDRPMHCNNQETASNPESGGTSHIMWTICAHAKTEAAALSTASHAL